MRWMMMALAAAAPMAAPTPTTSPTKPLYEDTPEIVSLLKELGENQSARLPKCRITGAGIAEDATWSKRTPGVRDYCNRMAYAPDRKTGMYAGANHQAPSRLNDAWEFHLGSNTWIRLAVPDGGDHGAVNRAMQAVSSAARPNADDKTRKAGADAEAFLKTWFSTYAVFQDGYLQTRTNGGPVCPWHTWDALTYDQETRRLLWAVLDTDPIMMNYAREYAKYAAQDYGKIEKAMKPGTGLYMFDPSTGRWRRQTGPDPRPYLRGMGGSMAYVPELKKSIWYCAAQNVSPNDFAMWTYDAVANVWADLKPNGGRSIRELVHTDKVAPSSEQQMAYSAKHRKLVAVLGPDTFIYDVDKNVWSFGVKDERNKASDSSTVFVYDSRADRFILINAPKGQWELDREVRAFSLDTMTWETLAVDGPNINRQPYCGQAGYYDPEHNVTVVYTSTESAWVFRCRQ
jgi:hypothetical protein